eukprot:g4380.t2
MKAFPCAEDHDLRQAAHCAWLSQTNPFEVSGELPSSTLIPTAQRQPRVDFVSSATAMKSIFLAVHRLGDWLVIDDGSELSWCPHRSGPDEDLWAERVRDAEQLHRACQAKVEAFAFTFIIHWGRRFQLWEALQEIDDIYDYEEDVEDKSLEDCRPPLSRRCEWPCLCCDGPGPGDCVICAEGYACQDQDRDGAELCSRPTDLGSLDDQQVGVWKMADDASVVVGSRLLCLGNSEHPKLTLYLHGDRMISDTILLEHWLECLMAGVPEFAVCFHRDGAVQSYSIYKLSELQRFLEERPLALMSPHRMPQLSLKDKKDASLKLIKLSGNDYPQDEGGGSALPVFGPNANGLVLKNTFLELPDEDEPSSFRRALSCPARFLGNVIEDDLCHVSPFCSRISTLFFCRAVSSTPGPDAARFFRQVLDLETYIPQVEDEEGAPARLPSSTAGRAALQACSHLGLALCELEAYHTYHDCSDEPGSFCAATVAEPAALLSRLRHDLSLSMRPRYRMLPWTRAVSNVSTVSALFVALPPWPSELRSCAPTDVAPATVALKRAGDALDLLKSASKEETKRLEALALPISALVLLQLASLLLKGPFRFLVMLAKHLRQPLLGRRAFAAIGDRFPTVDLHLGFPPAKVNTTERLAGKKTIVIGIPGAFTPVCSNQHVPGFLAQQSALKAKGVDEVLVCSVNDGAVMEAWGKDQKIDGSMVTFLADTEGTMAKALDLVLDNPTIREKLGGPRMKRFAMLVQDNVIQALAVAGDEVPDTATFAEAILEKC